jgi:hypothetical protein
MTADFCRVALEGIGVSVADLKLWRMRIEIWDAKVANCFHRSNWQTLMPGLRKEAYLQVKGVYLIIGYVFLEYCSTKASTFAITKLHQA